MTRSHEEHEKALRRGGAEAKLGWASLRLSSEESKSASPPQWPFTSQHWQMHVCMLPQPESMHAHQLALINQSLGKMQCLALSM